MAEAETFLADIIQEVGGAPEPQAKGAVGGAPEPQAKGAVGGAPEPQAKGAVGGAAEPREVAGTRAAIPPEADALAALQRFVDARRVEMRVEPLREEKVAGPDGVERVRRIYPGGLVAAGDERVLREEEAAAGPGAETALKAAARKLYGLEPLPYRGLLEASHAFGRLRYRSFAELAASPSASPPPPLRFHLCCALARMQGGGGAEGWVEVEDARGIVYEAAGRQFWVAGPVPIVCRADGAAPAAPAALLSVLLRGAHLSPPAAVDLDFPPSVPRAPIPIQVLGAVFPEAPSASASASASGALFPSPPDSIPTDIIASPVLAFLADVE
jgi:hypothetical protein